MKNIQEEENMKNIIMREENMKEKIHIIMMMIINIKSIKEKKNLSSEKFLMFLVEMMINKEKI